MNHVNVISEIHNKISFCVLYNIVNLPPVLEVPYGIYGDASVR